MADKKLEEEINKGHKIKLIHKFRDYSGVLHNPGETGYLSTGQDHGIFMHHEIGVDYANVNSMGTPISCIQIFEDGKSIPIKDTEGFLYVKGYK